MPTFWKGETRKTAKRRKQRFAVEKRQMCYAAVYWRAKGRCERCGIAIHGKWPRWHPQRAHMNHKTPLSRGGKDDPDNCELICQACHLPGGQHAPTAARQARLVRRDDGGL